MEVSKIILKAVILLLHHKILSDNGFWNNFENPS